MRFATSRLCLLIFVVIATTLACLCGCATKRLPQASGETPHDRAISAAVQKGMADDSLFDYGDVEIYTAKGVTELRGTVSSWEAIDRAYSIARGVQGVGQIQNNLTEKQR